MPPPSVTTCATRSTGSTTSGRTPGRSRPTPRRGASPGDARTRSPAGAQAVPPGSEPPPAAAQVQPVDQALLAVAEDDAHAGVGGAVEVHVPAAARRPLLRDQHRRARTVPAHDPCAVRADRPRGQRERARAG